jgi:cobalt-zinc-cadmium efflux system outer membrane protein
MVNSARHAAAGHLVNGADAEVELARRRVIARVRGLHATVLSLERQLTLARTAVGLKAELAKLAAARVEQRAATGLEESLAELDELEAKAQAVELLRKQREASAALAVELGLPSDSQLELTGAPLPCLAPGVPPSTLAERAVEDDPSMRVHQSRASALEDERGEARLALVPWFDYLQLSYVLASDSRPAYGALQLGTTLPLFNWNGHRVDLLAARGHREDEERELARRTLVKDIESTVAAIGEHAELLERYHSVEPKLLTQSRAQLDQALAAGAYSLSQVAQAQGRSLAAQRAGLKAELECQLLVVELDRLIGSKMGGTP